MTDMYYLYQDCAVTHMPNPGNKTSPHDIMPTSMNTINIQIFEDTIATVKRLLQSFKENIISLKDRVKSIL